MQKGDNEEWAVEKVCCLLGKYITALEIADRKPYSTPPNNVLPSNKPIHRERQGNSLHYRSTVGGC